MHTQMRNITGSSVKITSRVRALLCIYICVHMHTYIQMYINIDIYRL